MSNDDGYCQIASVLSQYHERFVEAYAVAISYVEVMPEQVNNEIRNMTTHMARASVSDDPDTKEKEIDLAIRHLERANRDCFKLAAIEANLQLKRVVGVIQKFKGGLTKTFYQEYSEALRERKDILRSEQQESATSPYYKSIAVRYEKLFTVLVRLQDDIYEEYNLNDALVRVYPKYYRTLRIGAWFLSLITAFVVGYSVNFTSENAKVLFRTIFN